MSRKARPSAAPEGLVLACLAGLLALPACKAEPPASGSAEAPAAPASVPAPLPCSGLEPLPARLPAADRVVAIGDLHGDLSATRAALRLAGAIDDGDRWIGGKLVVVQTGDLLDRGDDEQAILDLFERLATEAEAAGGAVHVLHGNHEIMNAQGDFRYVTPEGYTDFADGAGEVDEAVLASVPERARARAAALLPGGRYADLLADHPVALIVGATVFVHGGVSPGYARYGLEQLNDELRCWFRGGPVPQIVFDTGNPMWSRHFSLDPPRCDLLAASLELLDAERMVVGHTVQSAGINAACQGAVWRIDVGMSSAYGGPIEVLELRGNTVTVLREERSGSATKRSATR